MFYLLVLPCLGICVQDKKTVSNPINFVSGISQKNSGRSTKTPGGGSSTLCVASQSGQFDKLHFKAVLDHFWKIDINMYSDRSMEMYLAILLGNYDRPTN